MKNKIVLLASLALALTMLFSPAGTATASDEGSKDCKKSSKSREDGRDSESDCKKTAPTVSIVSPFDGYRSGKSTVTVTVAYTAPKKSGAKISLTQGGVVVGVFTVPANTTSGRVTFSAPLSILNLFNPSIFQAQLCTVSDSGREEDGDDDDGDDDDGFGGTKCIFSNTVRVFIGEPNPV